MRFYEFLADGEPKAEAIDGTGFGQPMKLLENPIEIFLWHATSPIGHRNFQFAIDYSAAQADRLSGRREFKRITQHIY